MNDAAKLAKADIYYYESYNLAGNGSHFRTCKSPRRTHAMKQDSDESKAAHNELPKRERGKGEGPGEGGGSPGELGEGPGAADLQRCWGYPEQSYQGRI